MTGDYATEREGLFHKRSTTFYLMAAAMGLLLFISVLKGVFFLGLLLAMNVALSLLMRPFKLLYIGAEVNILSAVLAGLAYGAVTGAIFGGISMLVNFIFMRRLSMWTLLMLPGDMLVGLIAPSFSGMGMAAIGVWMTLVYNLFVSLPIALVFRGNISKCFIFGITNVVFNFCLFSTLGEALKAMMV